jgi:hypothetical protein
MTLLVLLIVKLYDCTAAGAAAVYLARMTFNFGESQVASQPLTVITPS